MIPVHAPWLKRSRQRAQVPWGGAAACSLVCAALTFLKGQQAQWVVSHAEQAFHPDARIQRKGPPL